MKTEKKEFSKVFGNRIYITLPKKEDSKLIVDENTKEALNKELLKKMSHLTIYAVGAGVTDPDLVEGADVLVDPSKLSTGLLVPLSEDKDVLLISGFDIIHRWS